MYLDAEVTEGKVEFYLDLAPLVLKLLRVLDEVLLFLF